MRQISREEYDEWRGSPVTLELFKFFQLQADLWRGVLANGNFEGNDREVGEKYKQIRFAIDSYDNMQTIGYEDLVSGDNNETN